MKRLFFLIFLAAWVVMPSLASAAHGTQLFIWQGSYDQLGPNNEARAQTIARNDLVVVSHGFQVSARAVSAPGQSFPNPHGCMDVAYAALPAIIIRAKQLNPYLQVFAYVPATADRAGSDCPMPRAPRSPAADCPNRGVCANFVSWVDSWMALNAANPGMDLDGFFIDYFASTAITPSTRDNVLSYVRRKNMKVMVNLLTPNGAPDYVTFATHALSSRGLRNGDYVMMEGFYFAKGNRRAGSGANAYDFSQTPAHTRRAVREYLRYARGRGIRLAALATADDFLAKAEVPDPLDASRLKWAPSGRANGNLRCFQRNYFAASLAFSAFASTLNPSNRGVFAITNSDLGTDLSTQNVFNVPNNSCRNERLAYDLLPSGWYLEP